MNGASGVVQHLRQHYYPRQSEEAIREILSRRRRGSGRPSTSLRLTRQFLAGWLLSFVVDLETGTLKMPRDAEEAERMDGTAMVDETLSWLVAADRLAKENGVQLVVALILAGTVDPAVPTSTSGVRGPSVQDLAQRRRPAISRLGLQPSPDGRSVLRSA